YKNTLLETAVRRHISKQKDSEYNDAFSELIGMIHAQKDAAEVQTRISGLLEGLKGDLPGLPLVEGAVSEREAKRFAQKERDEKDWTQVTAHLFSEMDKALALYVKGDREGAAGLVQDAYFDIFEKSGMEAKIGAVDAGSKAKLEGHFSRIVGQMKKGASPEEIRETLKGMNADFENAIAMLGKSMDSPMAFFFYSLMIILREGFEAILIITAIIAYLVKMNHRDKLSAIYNGCIIALALSIVTAVLVKWVFKTSAASQEILEGATMLLATVVLFSVSYWLISKAEAQKWVAYIKDKVDDSISSGSVKALWLAAFLAVYREGAETVLFYQALGANAGPAGITAISGGFITGSILLIAVYLVIRYSAMKLPIRPFFMFTGALLYYMAFVFAGKGVMELIEGKLFQPSLISWMPTIPFMGVYPYLQTLVPQLLMALAALFGLAAIMKKRKVPAGASGQ
ncbi:MAG: FTR1 family protein, partial [bacterium]|nr:FTR1 family protein [bacterium]